MYLKWRTMQPVTWGQSGGENKCSVLRWLDILMQQIEHIKMNSFAISMQSLS